jgi:hypothetical protein
MTMRTAPLFPRLGPLSAILLACVVSLSSVSVLHSDDAVDTALLVSVDVSNSVDEHRYRLQMEGIAAALEDSAVMDAILNGPRSAILFSLVEWSDRPKVAIPWTKIATKAEANTIAAAIRKLPRNEGEFTCMANMLRFVSDKIVTQIPAQATKVVIDVSGDGVDNCNGKETTDVVRDELVAYGAVINGLPIIERAPTANAPAVLPDTSRSDDLESWYRNHVMGGAGAFVLPAYGYEDFGRAMRQKFVVEVSGLARWYAVARNEPISLADGL